MALDQPTMVTRQETLTIHNLQSSIKEGPVPSICHSCIGDEFLADELKEKGTYSNCNYCGKENEAVPLDTLAERVHDVIEEHFRLIPSEPEDPEDWLLQHLGQWPPIDGYSITDIVTDLVEGSDKFVSDLICLMADIYDPPTWGYKDSLDIERLYGPDSEYQERSLDDKPFHSAWNQFKQEIQSRARFFSTNADMILHEIFGDLTTLQTFDGRPVIREVNPSDRDLPIWRGRVAQSHADIDEILKSPTSQLGPPPSHWEDGQISPPDGRMNAPGVSVFYGASKLSTCVAEVRVPVGSYVVAAKFELLRSVQLLDLDALENVYTTGSYFDPDLGERASRAVFLRKLATLISQPVMPQDEATEYLATQAIAEFLANKQQPRLDGITFRSSQSGDGGHNVVLFNHARTVEPYTPPPGTEIWTHIPPDGSGYGSDDDIHVVERRPPDQTSEETNASGDGPLHLNLLEAASGTPTLALDHKSLVVLEIQGIQYTEKRRSVRWDRFDDSR